MGNLLVLVEPYFHGTQYLDVAIKKHIPFLVLRREDGPKLVQYKEQLIVDIDNIDDAAKKLARYLEDKGDESVGIIPGNDFVVPFAFGLSEKLKLDYNSYETGMAARNKYNMFLRLKEAGVSVPKTIRLVEDTFKVPNDVVYPMIVKPEDMSSSMYVYKIEDQNELIDRVNKTLAIHGNILGYKKTVAVLLQEFVSGNEFSIELLFDNGSPVYASVTQKQKSKAPFFVELGHVVGAVNITVSENNELIDEAAKAAKAIGLKNGPAHVEIVLSADNGPVVIEIAARIGGDNIMKLVREAYGVYIPELAVSQALNLPFVAHKNKWAGAAIRFITADSVGKITEITGVDRMKSDTAYVESGFDFEVGDQLKAVESSDDRVGYVIARGKTGEEAKINAKRLERMIYVETTNETR